MNEPIINEDEIVIIDESKHSRRSSFRQYQSPKAAEYAKYKLILSSVLQSSNEESWVTFDHRYVISNVGNGFSDLRSTCKKGLITYVMVKYNQHIYLLDWHGPTASARQKVDFTGKTEPLKEYFTVSKASTIELTRAEYSYGLLDKELTAHAKSSDCPL